MSIAEALAEWDVDPNHFASARRAPETLIGYLEPHIEQAPYLYEQDLPLAIVSSIAAQSRFYVTLTGQAAHAGSSMKTRRDALSAAAEMMLAIETIAQGGRMTLSRHVALSRQIRARPPISSRGKSRSASICARPSARPVTASRRRCWRRCDPSLNVAISPYNLKSVTICPVPHVTRHCPISSLNQVRMSRVPPCPSL